MGNRKETSCSCERCQSMCMSSPCFPTPADAKKLISAGLGLALSPTCFADVRTQEVFPLVSPRGFSHKEIPYPYRVCIFFEQGLCQLHDKGLKPTEGKLTYCGQSKEDALELRREICKTWDTDEGKEVIRVMGGEDIYESAKKYKKTLDKLKEEYGEEELKKFQI